MSVTNPLYDALFAPHAGAPRPLLRTPDGARLSYAEFLGLAARMGRALIGAGVAPGDRVIAQVEKSPELLALYAGCVSVGAVFTPLNTAYTDAELAYFVSDAEPKALIVTPGRRDAAEDLARAVGATVFTLDAAGGGDLLSAAAAQAQDQVALAGASALAPRQQDDLAAILYTSGTTGRSKGAMLSQQNLLSNALALTDLWRFTGEDVLLHALPIFHTHGLFVASNVIFAVGGAMIFLPKFDLAALKAHLPDATSMMGVPTYYTRMIDEPALARADVAHLRLFVSGSAPLRAESHVAFEEKFGHRILERYGMTETNMITSNPYDGARRAGTVGTALPGVSVRIAAVGGAPLAPGEIGGIEVQGPNVCQGYWRNPEKTREAFHADGWFITGDLGVLDADGYLTIVGREKDLVIAGGYNIYPKEIESEIDAVAGVVESAVFGAPHPDLGEGLVAAVVPAAGAPVTADAILAAIAPRLARFKHPRRIEIVDALPRNAMGKVQKNLLRDRFRDAFT